MGRLVWFGVIALSPAAAGAAIAGLLVAGAVAGFAMAKASEKKLEAK